MIDNDKVPELTNSGFEDFVKEGFVLVDFFAEWCMPCMMMGPIVDELSEKFKGKIKFGKVNIEDNQSLAEKFEVRSIPNFVLFKDGKAIDNFVGGMSQEDFEEKLKGHL
ncbi:MAG: thioredoxin [Candidatus Pacearchaeota archaeon]|jgi:thioredoxin 1